jgi:hypothetical protein
MEEAAKETFFSSKNLSGNPGLTADRSDIPGLLHIRIPAETQVVVSFPHLRQLLSD